MLIPLLALVLAQQPAPAPACPATPAPLAAPLAGWSSMAPVQAGAAPGKAPALAPGRAVRATLVPAAGLTYAAPLAKPAAPGSYGGLFALTVASAGRYRVALGSGAWVDVVAAGKPLASAAHGHGPDCSGVRKMVDFDLKPGAYLIQVAGNAAPTIGLMVARVP